MAARLVNAELSCGLCQCAIIARALAMTLSCWNASAIVKGQTSYSRYQLQSCRLSMRNYPGHSAAAAGVR